MKWWVLLLLIFLVACGAAAPAVATPDLRATLTAQLDQMDADLGASGAANAQRQADWLILHPELQRYHAWYFGVDTEHIRGAFEGSFRARTPASLLRDPATMARYLDYVAQQR